MGKFFEELEEGAGFASPTRRITGEDVDQFVALTGDDNRLHTDDEFARAAGFERRIVHGALVVSIATGLAWRTGVLTDTALAFREIESWKFSAPVYPNDELTLRGRVSERRPLPRLKAGLVRFDMEVVNQHGAVVSSGVLRLLMRMRPAKAGA